MYPTLIEFQSSHLKEFQITKVSGHADVGELISELRLNSLIEKACVVGQIIKYTVYSEDRKSLTNTIDTTDKNFYFTILCWAWKIDKELNANSLVTFGVDLDNFKPGQVIELDKFLNIGYIENSLVLKHISFLKDSMCDHLVIKINSHWRHKGIENKVEKKFNGSKLVIQNTNDTSNTGCIVMLFFLLAIGFNSCMSDDCFSKTNSGPMGGSYSYEQIKEYCEGK